MSLLERLNSDLKEALRERDILRANVIRGLKSEIKYKEIEKKTDLTEENLVAVLTFAAKKHRDSIEQFKAGGRDDLVEKETSELELISAYLPEQLSDDELAQLVQTSIDEADASGPSDLGKVMKVVMPKVKGRADGSKVREMVLARLSD